MHFLAVLIVPLLMLADYYLTLWGAIQRERSGYARFFVIENYELNPTFQADIAKRRWVNPRHLLIVLLLTVFLLTFTFLMDATQAPTLIFDLFMGFIYTLYLVLIGAHTANLLTFRYVQTNSLQLTGEVRMGPELTVTQSQNQILIVLLPLVVMAIVTQSFFVIGGVLGVLRMIISLMLWKRRARLKARQQARTLAGGVQAK